MQILTPVLQLKGTKIRGFINFLLFTPSVVPLKYRSITGNVCIWVPK